MGCDMKITKDTIIMDAFKLNSRAKELFEERGMHCLTCPTAETEGLEHAALVHAFDLDELLEELNKDI